MGLNFTLEVYLSFISGGILAIVLIGLLHQYKGKKERIVLWFLIFDFFYFLYFALEGLAILFVSLPTYQFGLIAFYFAGFYLLFGIDALTQDGIDPIKASIWTWFVVILFFLGFQPDSLITGILPNGGQTILITGLYQNLFGTSIILINGVLIYNSVRIFRHSSEKIKKYALIIIITAILFTLSSTLFALNINGNIPGIHMIIAAMGMILLFFTFVKQPQLAYVLHLHVLRLSVIDTKGGLTLFSHDWEQDNRLVDSRLFTGTLQGIGIILDQAINQGEIKEIRLKQAVLLINRSDKHSVACILVATKEALVLRQALDGFARDFYAQFASKLQKLIVVDNYLSATQLITKWFSFVPSEK